MRRLIVDASPTVPVCLMWHTYSNLSIRGKKFAKRANWSVLYSAHNSQKRSGPACVQPQTDPGPSTLLRKDEDRA